MRTHCPHRAGSPHHTQADLRSRGPTLHSPEQKSPLEAIRSTPYHGLVLLVTVALCPGMSLLPGTASLSGIVQCPFYRTTSVEFHSILFCTHLPYGLQNSKEK